MAFYGAAMAPDLKHPATGDLIVLTGGEQLWRIGWPDAPVLVVTGTKLQHCEQGVLGIGIDTHITSGIEQS